MKTLILLALAALAALYSDGVPSVHAAFILPELRYVDDDDKEPDRRDKEIEKDEKRGMDLEPIPPRLKEIFPWPKEDMLKEHKDLENKLKKHEKETK